MTHRRLGLFCAACAHAVSSQAWTDGATRFQKDYVAESNDAATATEQAFANTFSGAEDSLVGFINCEGLTDYDLPGANSA